MNTSTNNSVRCVRVCVCEMCKTQLSLGICVCVRSRHSVCVYLRFLRRDAGSFASSVLTSPNSCMTLSSCLRSSWPFSRNMNSCPLLPADGAVKCNDDDDDDELLQQYRNAWNKEKVVKIWQCCISIPITRSSATPTGVSGILALQHSRRTVKD